MLICGRIEEGRNCQSTLSTTSFHTKEVYFFILARKPIFRQQDFNFDYRRWQRDRSVRIIKLVIVTLYRVRKCHTIDDGNKDNLHSFKYLYPIKVINLVPSLVHSAKKIIIS
jgi:hypothetical protein